MTTGRRRIWDRKYGVTSYRSNSIWQSPSWERIGSPASQEIPRTLLSPKVHDGAHKSPPLVPVLNHTGPLQAFPFYSLEVDFLILSYIATSSRLSLALSSPPQNALCTSSPPPPPHTFRPSHLHWFDHPDNTCCGVQMTKLLITQSSPFPCLLCPT
jgi:hypothetical protein